MKYGKTISEIQDNIMIADNAISGTLKKVESYPGFGDAEANNPNYYLALSFDTNADKIVTKVIGGTEQEVDITADKFCVYRIKNNTQKIEIKTTKDNQINTKVYSLEKLTLSS